MRVLLTTLPSPFLDNDKAFPQLGILYLLSAAKAAGHKVYYRNHPHLSGLEANTYGPNCIFYTDVVDLKMHDPYEHYDAVAISAVTPQGAMARELLTKLKKRQPGRPVMIGGPHATHYPQECLDAGFDYVVAGDGEQFFVRFLKHEILATGGAFERHTSADEMNEMPPPLREKAYLSNYGEYYLKGRRATSMIVSRGCANKCAFCEDAGTSPRWYTPEHFEREVLDVKACGFDAVMLYDDLFAISAKKVKPYAEILQKHDVIYRCFTHARSICKDPELVEILAGTGCVAVGFGAESMDDDILETINKHTTSHMNYECVDRCVRAGLNVKSFFMLGLPGETAETAQKMHDFVQRNRKAFPELYDFDQASIFFPYKGTEIGDSLRRGETRYDLRLVEGLTWEQVDRECLGAHKAAGGKSEHITETSALSCEELVKWQAQIKLLSKRFDGRELREGVYK